MRLEGYPEVLKIPHVVKITGLSRSTVYDLLRQNKIKHKRPTERNIIILREWLEEYLNTPDVVGR